MSEQQYMKIDLLVANATIEDIQGLYRTNQLTVEELVIYYLKRIEKYDVNQLNTVMELNPDVIKLAREQDVNKGTGDLYGIPVLLKGNIGTGDRMHTTAGAYALKDSVLQEDSFVVKQLRQAGAIMLGKANLSEFANFMSSASANGYSTLGGQTHNPYGNYDVGGSSSGSAAAAAANLATVTIGTETGGSIIYPSSQNSVVGVKPTVGLVSRDRIIPIAEIFDTPGVITRYVSDAARVLNIIAGSDSNDAATAQADQLKQDYAAATGATDLKGKKLLVLDVALRTGDQEKLEEVVQQLQSLGAEIVDTQVDIMELFSFNSSELMVTGIKFDMEKYLGIANVKGMSSVEDIVRFNQEDLSNRAAYGQDLLEMSANDKTTLEQFEKKADSQVKSAAAYMDQLLSKNGADAIVSLSNNLSALYATAGYPAVNVPAGYRATGEPVGATFTSTKFTEAQLLQIAAAYEQATKLRKSPVLQ